MIKKESCDQRNYVIKLLYNLFEEIEVFCYFKLVFINLNEFTQLFFVRGF